MKLRKYTEQDLPAIQEIHQANHRHQGGMLCSTLHTDPGYYVMEDQGKVIAYADIAEGLPDRMTDTNLTFPLCAANKNSVHIRQIAVLPDYQGQGVGSKLYYFLFFQLPCRDYYAYVRDSNINSLHFHKKVGFYRVGEYCTPDFHSAQNYRAYLLLCPGAPILPS